MDHSDRDVLLAVISGAAVGLLALSFPSPIALLGLVPGVIASVDLVRRRQLTAVGALLLTAAVTAGLPSGLTLFGPGRVAGAGLPAATAAVFGAACGALILGVMLLLLEPGAVAAAEPETTVQHAEAAEPSSPSEASTPDSRAEPGEPV